MKLSEGVTLNYVNCIIHLFFQYDCTKSICNLCITFWTKYKYEEGRLTCLIIVTIIYWVLSLFQEEIGACAAVHTCYVMNACDRVRPIILFPPMMGMSFVLVMLIRLIVSKPKHQVTWSHTTCVNFPFLRGERIQYLSVSA